MIIFDFLNPKRITYQILRSTPWIILNLNEFTPKMFAMIH